MISRTEKPSCYLCGSSNCSRIHDTIRYNLSPRPYRCSDCGFVYLFPRMTHDEERMFYESIYRAHYETQPPEELWNDSLPEAKIRAARFKNLCTKNTRVLEIGCATGVFLAEIRDSVKSITGVELTSEYVRFALARGLDVKESLQEIPDASYDIIFMFHVLEHIDDPIQFLKEIKSKLAPSGKLIIEVPNVDDILVSTYKIPAHLDFYWEIAHNYYFSKTSLGTVLKKAGYIYEIFPLQRYDLSNHMNWMLTGKPGGQGRFHAIFPQSLLDEYENALKEQFLCDTIYAVAT